MNKEFIPYDQALELKELGFNEVCSFYYKNKLIDDCINAPKTNSVGEFISENFECTAPLYQQAFRWFREYYNLDSFVQHHFDGLNETYFSMTRKTTWDVTSHNTYEEAELACLKKLIEVIKNK